MKISDFNSFSIDKCTFINSVRPTHFLIVSTLSENQINSFMARKVNFFFKRITSKTNFQL